VDHAGSVAGKVVVAIQIAPEQLSELEALVTEHHGRIETEQQTDEREIG
jgi:hypothetical protein